MSNTTVTLMIIIVVVLVLVLGAGAFFAWRKNRSDRLRERFGPEYDRAVGRSDDAHQAESELRQREKRNRELELQPLRSEQRAQYEHQWELVQGEFVEDPSRAVRDADQLVVQVMSARGYPVQDFDRRAEDLSVQYPDLTQRYRTARDIARANERGEASTEQLRDATTSYRSLVAVLLEDEPSSRA